MVRSKEMYDDLDCAFLPAEPMGEIYQSIEVVRIQLAIRMSAELFKLLLSCPFLVGAEHIN